MATELMLYGDIGADWWSGDGITEEMVHEGLVGLDATAAKHVVHINSPGGRVDTGLAIMNLLRSHKEQMRATNADFKLETVCDAYAMSSGSVIFMAGDIRTIALGGIVMIHDAWSGCYGNAAELRKSADVMDKLSENIANIYAALCTPADKDAPARDAGYYRSLMLEETYMISNEAVTYGIATQLDPSLQANLCKDLTPENLKGKYVARMTAGYKKRTLSKPTAAASLTNLKLALQRFKVLEAAIIA